MKLKQIAILCFVLLMQVNVFAQTGCVNPDFSSNNFTNWVGRTGSCCPINTPATGIVNGRHTIMTGNGMDPRTCNNVSVVAPGRTYSAKLGNEQTGCQAERLSYTVPVTATNSLFTYEYAVVLQDPGHAASSQPRFQIRVLNAAGQLISPTCGFYTVTAAANIAGFRSCGSTRYRAWTPVGIDLSAYVGTNITVEFSTGDCGACGHYGYAYVVAECNKMSIDVSYCPNNSNVAILTAPRGFTYQWNTGETSRTITVVGPPDGATYSCVLTAVTGCQATVTANITSNVVVTDFLNNSGCPGESIQFNDLSTVNNSNITAWQWDFGDGTTSTDQNPTHSYVNSGTYNVTLTAFANSNCSNVMTKPVTINPMPVANFTATDVCISNPTVFTNNSIFQNSITSFSWDFGDGTPLNTTTWTPTHTYAAPGTYQAKVTVTSNTQFCSDTYTLPVTVYANPVADFTIADVCENIPVQGTDISQGSVAQWRWNMGDGSSIIQGQNITYFYTAPGAYNVNLNVTSINGCVSQATKSVTVFSMPTVGYTAADVCSGNAVTFQNSTTIAAPYTISSYQWDYGDGSAPNTTTWNPNYSYANPGNYTVVLTTTSSVSGCNATFIDSVNVFATPIANFGFNDVCLDQTVNFLNQSQGNIISWAWNFGDGSPIDNNSNTNHQYSVSGTYNVNLLVTTLENCQSSITQAVVAFPLPVSQFATSDVCIGTSSSFTDQSQIGGGGSISIYDWDFGDGSPHDFNQNSTYTYNAPGTYNISLLVTSSDGCKHRSILPHIVYPNPLTIFFSQSVCDGDAMQFQNLSNIVPPFTIPSWTWDFGDGTAVNTVDWNPAHSYATPGKYEVTLTAYPPNSNCFTVYKDSVNVYPLPKADFSTNNVCLQQQADFSDLSQGTITYWEWEFGDATPINYNSNISHLYTNPGTFDVELKVTTLFGCMDSITRNITIYPLPVADFTAPDVCHGTPTQFLDASSISSGNSIVSWRWNFADNSPMSTSTNPTTQYVYPANYHVQLLVSSNNSCLDSIVKTITVNPNPVVNFLGNPLEGCSPLCIQFQDMSNILTGGIASRKWTFGDGETASAIQPVKCYLNNTNFNQLVYDVSLESTSDKGCVTTELKNSYVTVHPLPKAVFEPLPAVTSVIYPIVRFDNKSIASIVWNWDFGDAGIDGYSDEQFPSYTYNDTGNFNVRLVVFNQYSCSDTVSHAVIIEPTFTIYVPTAFSPNEDFKNDVFTISGYGLTAMEMTIFNRWGEQVFKTRDMEKGWDGRKRDQTEYMKPDVYTYVIKVKNLKEEEYTYRGKVTLVR